MRTAILTAIIVLSGALTASPVPAKGVVEIRMRSYYYAAPATVSVVVAVEPGSNNRALVVEADGEDYYRSSEIELDGEKEKRFHTLQFTSLPAGSYVLRAQVLSTSKVLGKAEAELVVSGILEQP